MILIFLLFFMTNSFSSYYINKTCIEDYDCTDDIWCNGIEICDTDLNECVYGIKPCIDHYIDDKFNITCNEEMKTCNINIICFNDKDCNDNFLCNGIEFCNLTTNKCHKIKGPICDTDKICNITLNKCMSLYIESMSNEQEIPSVWILILTVILIIMISLFLIFFITMYIFNKIN
jgi:hypothetical protein